MIEMYVHSNYQNNLFTKFCFYRSIWQVTWCLPLYVALGSTIQKPVHNNRLSTHKTLSFLHTKTNNRLSTISHLSIHASGDVHELDCGDNVVGERNCGRHESVFTAMSRGVTLIPCSPLTNWIACLMVLWPQRSSLGCRDAHDTDFVRLCVMCPSDWFYRDGVTLNRPVDRILSLAWFWDGRDRTGCD